jgi:hypothetical protein
MNHDLNYTISFSDNFSAELNHFGQSVSTMVARAKEMNAAFEAINPHLRVFKQLLEKKSNIGYLNDKLGKMQGQVTKLTNHRNGIPALNQHISTLFRKMGGYDDIVKLGMDKAVGGVRRLDAALDKHDANMAQSIAATKAKTVAIREQQRAITSLNNEYRATPKGGIGGGGGSRGGRTSSKQSTLFQRGRRMRDVGQGMFQTGAAAGFALMPLVGAAGSGMKFNSDIDEMLTGAKLRNSDIAESASLQKELTSYLRKSFSESPYDRDTASEILSELGARGISFKNKGKFTGSAAQKFFSMNLMANKALDMNPKDLAKYQSFVLAQATKDKVVGTEAQVAYTGDRFKYLNYIADTYGIKEKDIVSGVNDKIRASVTAGSNAFTMNAEDDATALSAFFQRGTGKEALKASSVAASVIKNMSSMRSLVGTDKQAGVLSEEQAINLGTVIREKGQLKGIHALGTLINANKKAQFEDMLANGTARIDSNGAIQATDKATEKDKFEISSRSSKFKARLDKTLGEYGAVAISMFSDDKLKMLGAMSSAKKEDVDKKGLFQVDEKYRESWKAHTEMFANSSARLSGSLMNSLLPSLMSSMEVLVKVFNSISDFLERHPVVAKGLAGAGLAGIGAAGAIGAGGIALNAAGTIMQGYSGAGEAMGKYSQYKKTQKRVKNIENYKKGKVLGTAMSTMLNTPMYGMPKRGFAGKVSKGVKGAFGAVAKPVGALAGNIAKGAKGGLGTFSKVAGAGALVELGGVMASVGKSALALMTSLNPVSIAIYATVGALTLWLSQFKEMQSLFSNSFTTIKLSFELLFSSIQLLFSKAINFISLEISKNPVLKKIFKPDGQDDNHFVNKVGKTLNDKISNVNMGLSDRIKITNAQNTYENLNSKVNLSRVNEDPAAEKVNIAALNQFLGGIAKGNDPVLKEAFSQELVQMSATVIDTSKSLAENAALIKTSSEAESEARDTAVKSIQDMTSTIQSVANKLTKINNGMPDTIKMPKFQVTNDPSYKLTTRNE